MKLLLAFTLCATTAVPTVAFQARPVRIASVQPLNIRRATASGNVPLVGLASTSTTGEDIKESTQETIEWTKKRLHNNIYVRGAAILVVLAAAGSLTPQAIAVPAPLAASLHMLSFATWFGSVAYTTFIAGITMFRSLPRQTFGKLQSKLFPRYFALGSSCLVIQIMTLKSLSSLAATMPSIRALGVALAMTLFNQFYLEPKSSENMLERYRLEDVPGGKESDRYKNLRSNFGKFHGMSSLTNLIALLGGVAHAVYIARALVG